MGNTVTKFVVVGVILLLGIYDLVAVLWFGPSATLSRVVGIEAGYVPAVPFALGFVAGHLFWPQKTKET